MPRFDQHCLTCTWDGEIVVRPFEDPPCPVCGGQTERLWRASAAVIGDDIPGGLLIENLAHLPVKVYSKSELKRKMKEYGVEPYVKHQGVHGSDKSPYTSRWI